MKVNSESEGEGRPDRDFFTGCLPLIFPPVATTTNKSPSSMVSSNSLNPVAHDLVVPHQYHFARV